MQATNYCKTDYVKSEKIIEFSLLYVAHQSLLKFFFALMKIVNHNSFVMTIIRLEVPFMILQTNILQRFAQFHLSFHVYCYDLS